MSTRMSRYDASDVKTSSRIEKNKKLYEEVSDIDIDYIDINVDNILEIGEEDLIKTSRSTYQKRKEFESLVTPKEEETIYEEIPIRKNRIYDINEVLKQAKEEARFQALEEEKKNKKRLISTEYNILTKLDIKDIDSRELKEEEIKEIVKNTYHEEEVDNNEELFKHMLDDPNEIEEEKELTEEILNKEVEDVFEDTKKEITNNMEEIAVKIEDNSQTTDNIYTTTTTQFLEKEKKSKKMLVFIIIVVILLLGVVGYLLLNYFGTL